MKTLRRIGQAKMSALLFLLLLTTFPARAADSSCTKFHTEYSAHINLPMVQATWLNWINRLRRRENLPPYVLNPFLNASAQNWSTYAVKRGTIDHKRYAGSPYYDYSAIEQWFANRGLTFKNVDSVTFSENIGWGSFKCNSADCTTALLAATRSTFDFFVKERSAASRPHWNCLVNDHFKEIGIGVAYSNEQNRYYLTVHYGTQITSMPPMMCG